MSYELNIDLRAHDDIASLPAEALGPLAEAMTFLQLTPWNARAINRARTPPALCEPSPSAPPAWSRSSSSTTSSESTS